MATQRTIVLNKTKPATGRKRVSENVARNVQEKPTVAKAVPQAGQELRTVDVEQLSRNIAKMVEQGGKALAAYLKPREQGEVRIEPADEIADVVKTLGHVAEYWLSDPQRAVEVQTSLGKAYLELWASAMHRMAGEAAPPVVQPDSRDKRFS